jgi:hypothetical protein
VSNSRCTGHDADNCKSAPNLCNANTEQWRLEFSGLPTTQNLDRPMVQLTGLPTNRAESVTSVNHPGTLGRCAGSVIDEHDLAFNGTSRQKFHSLSRLNKRERAANQRIDLLLREEREDLRQILAQRLRVLPV